MERPLTENGGGEVELSERRLAGKNGILKLKITKKLIFFLNESLSDLARSEKRNTELYIFKNEVFRSDPGRKSRVFRSGQCRKIGGFRAAHTRTDLIPHSLPHREIAFERGHEKMCLMPYANNKDADQPAHPRSLISVFVVRCLDSIFPLVSTLGQSSNRSPKTLRCFVCRSISRNEFWNIK